jgi:hypothetical protein
MLSKIESIWIRLKINYDFQNFEKVHFCEFDCIYPRIASIFFEVSLKINIL